MKTFLKKASTFAILLLSAAMVMTACKNGNGNGTSDGDTDKAALETLITECETLFNDATTADFPQANIDAFKSAIDAAKSIRDNENATQTQINQIVNSLTLAKNTFINSKYQTVPESSVISFFNFDTASTTTVTASGTKPVVAVLKAGPEPIFGADTSLPTFIEGVNGGKAIYLSKGNYLAVEEYNPQDFLKNNMSWSVWVKADNALRPNNYIVSLNYWNNWKFNIQENGKPLFTVKTTTNTVDMDNEAVGSVENGKWVHLAVTMSLDTHTVVFYVNGVVSKTWTTATKENLTGTIAAPYQSTLGQLPLLIGAATIYDEALTWTWDGWNTPESWDSMRGAIDNLGIYNETLSPGQIARLYQDQKPAA